MWEMFDDILECDECGGPLGPPPKFMIPPPPRPPALADFGYSNCNEEEMALKAQQAWDNDICEAIPILDASLYSSPTLQTSAMIAVFSLLLVLVVLISSLFVWKNKRKVQNLLPCKTPTRGPHINGGLQLGTSHTVTYEEPDAHLGHHRPLVMRHHHNVEMMHGKSIHYPSGYPMTRSPPFLVSSSPGPDPYRSNDNVYEELGPSRESDGESDPPMHSDDDFAEDELSLPGERSFNKNNGSETTPTLPTTPGSNLYHERPSGSVANNSSTLANGPERISVLSSSSSTQDASTATVMSTNSSHNNNCNHNNNNTNNNNNNSSVNGSLGGRSGGSIFSGMLRHTTGRNKNTSRARAEPRGNEMNTSTSTADTTDFVPVQQLYDNRSNLMTLAYMPSQHQNHNKATHLHQPYQQGQLQNNNLNNNGPNAHAAAPSQFYNSLDNEVDRRNRINTQMNKQQVPAVATIFRERIHYPGSGRYPQPYYASNSANAMLSSSMRARTNPRSIDRRHRITAPLEPLEPAYGYAEPVFQHQVNNYHYDTCGTTALQHRLPPYPAYIIPEYASGPSVAVSGGSYRGSNLSVPLQHSQQYQNPTQLYARGDSSFGSDSGYSHHTPASSIGRHDYEPTLHVTGPPNSSSTHAPKTPSKLSAAFNFGWNRRKNATPNNNPPANLNVTNTINRTDPTSPNNNSANATSIAATLEANSPVVSVAAVTTSINTSTNSSGSTAALNNIAKA